MTAQLRDESPAALVLGFIAIVTSLVFGAISYSAGSHPAPGLHTAAPVAAPA